MPEPPVFKALVVGGGPVGLTTALALQTAGIAFTLLEQQPQIITNAGSNLVLTPMTLRTMSALGLSDQVNRVSTPLASISRMSHAGADIGRARWFEMLKEKTGLAPRVISRFDLVSHLYSGLSQTSRDSCLAGKRLASIHCTADGVEVECADGSRYAGSLVIAADGAHSRVRAAMRDLAIEAGSDQLNLEQPYLTTYRCLWLRFPNTSVMKPGMTCETHGTDAATQFFVGEDSAVVALYERIAQPTRERQRYTQADQDAVIKRWGHLPLVPATTLTLADAYEVRLNSGLVSLEEGVVDNWSWDGRIVLAGDAAHKFTPSTGQGCNEGMLDAVSLVDSLYALRSSQPCHTMPTKSDLAKTFQLYQRKRIETVKAFCAGSSQATQTATWTNAIFKFMDIWVISFAFVQKLLAGSVGSDANAGLSLQLLQRNLSNSSPLAVGANTA